MTDNNCRKTRSYLRGLAIILYALLPLGVVSQEPEEPPPPAATDQEERTAMETAPSPASGNGDKVDEPFLPSESISEDLSVPFPVDI